MHIVFYGPEGSGKGTQAKLLATKLGVPHLVSGDLVRHAAEEDNGILGDVVRRSLAAGKYVPDSEMFVLWKDRLKKDDARKGWVLDGFPRNLKQAKFLFNKVDKYGYSIDKFIYLNISSEESLDRLKERHREQYSGAGKNHDAPELVKSRLGEFMKGQNQLIKYIKEKGVLLEIDGSKSVEDVTKEIFEKLGI